VKTKCWLFGIFRNPVWSLTL